jgi:hypothetical protein
VVFRAGEQLGDLFMPEDFVGDFYTNSETRGVIIESDKRTCENSAINKLIDKIAVGATQSNQLRL